MKKMSPREQLELLRKGRKKLRDLSMKGRMMAAQEQAQQDAQQAAEQDVLAPVYSNYSSTLVSYNRVKVKKKKPIIATIYER